MGNKKISMVVLFFFFSFASSLSCLKISQAVDTLSRCQSINDSEILTSSGGIFYLGFFSPANSRNRYVGIRYKSNFTDGVVWVANRENPIPDSSGTLNFTSNGDLTISQGNQTILSLYSHNSTSNSTLKLLDSGNLVLREGNSDTQVGILWQSFDHPTNTLLPGMTLGFNSKTQKNTSLCSSISAQVLAPGPFNLGVDPNGTKQLVIWERGEVYWTSGVWDGKNFSLAPSMLSIYSFDISFVSNEDEHSFTYTVSDDSSGVNAWSMAANFEGQITLTNSRYMSWSPHCKGGAFSTVDYSEGCVRVQQPNCMEGNEFNEFTTKVFFDPLLELEDRSLALTDCENVCKRNCSCTAYSSADPNGTGCSFWHGEEGRPPYNSEHLAYARTANNINRKKRPVLLIGLTSALIALFMSFIMCFLWRRKQLKQRREKKMSNERILFEMSANGIDNDEFNYTNNHEGGGKKGPDLRLFSFAFISTATDNFSTSNKLGQGGFGPVYKGKLPSGKEIAVKRLSRSSGQGLEEFKNEIMLIAKLQHMNLVRLIGCCIQGEEKLLIYEYMPNKSLDFYIFDPTKGRLLDWRKRINIIEGITQGLLYLHKYSRLKIIHRDLKASNILLDGEMNPKISDFGMARIFDRNETQANTGRIVGTYGYMSPEYAMEGLFSEKSDVFSFGVLLLEVVTGKRSTSLYHSQDSLNLIGYAWELWKDDKALALVDTILGDSSPSLEFLRYIHIALLCVQERATNRPTMSDVVSMLSNESVTLPNPKQPAFLITRCLTEGDAPTRLATNISINDVTISDIKGR